MDSRDRMGVVLGLGFLLVSVWQTWQSTDDLTRAELKGHAQRLCVRLTASIRRELAIAKTFAAERHAVVQEAIATVEGTP